MRDFPFEKWYMYEHPEKDEPYIGRLMKVEMVPGLTTMYLSFAPGVPWMPFDSKTLKEVECLNKAGL